MPTDTMPRIPRGAGPGGRRFSPGGTHPPGPPLGTPGLSPRGDPSPRTPLGKDYPSPRTPLTPGRAMPPATRDPRTRTVSAPRHTRPMTKPATRPTLRPAIGRTRPRHPRAPFILLLVGLLGGALISLLVISTTLAEGSYQITNLQQQNANLAKQEQLLTQQVAQASSPAQIAQEAEALGMQPNPDLKFINLKTGKIVSGHPSTAESEINVPGYTP